MPKTKNKPNINPKDWVSYFSNLLNIKNKTENRLDDEEFRKYIKHSLPVIEKDIQEKGHLGYEMTVNELEQALKKFKKTKIYWS